MGSSRKYGVSSGNVIQWNACQNRAMDGENVEISADAPDYISPREREGESKKEQGEDSDLHILFCN